MSIYITRQMIDPASGKPAGSKSIGLLRRMFRRAVRNWQRRKMIAKLEAMDDRLLRDIGLHRGEIRRLVDGFDDRELGMVPVTSAETSAGTDYEAFRKAA